MNIFCELCNFLLQKKSEIVFAIEIMRPLYSHTYPGENSSPSEVDVIDFERLCLAIDEFGRTLPGNNNV